MTSTKRTLTDATIDTIPSTKKRKLVTNTDNDTESKSDDTNTTDTKSTSNDIKSTWKFSESGFTFGDNSNILLNNNTLNEIKKSISDPSDTKDTKTEKDTESSTKENKTTSSKPSDDPWSNIWGGSNTDGTFKLNFNWGNWENDNNKIDLNPNTSIGWESTAIKYDPNNIKGNKQTQKVVESMGGLQDSGDKMDETQYEIHCKIYNLENNKYIEKGLGNVQLNMYKMDDENDGKKARILCRRDGVLNTIINASISKDMKFEKVGSFIRFGVVEMIGNNDGNNEDNVKVFLEENNEDDCDLKQDDKDKDNGNEDDDLKAKTVVKTYLIKPSDKTKIDVLLGKIKDIQKQVSK